MPIQKKLESNALISRRPYVTYGTIELSSRRTHLVTAHEQRAHVLRMLQTGVADFLSVVIASTALDITIVCAIWLLSMVVFLTTFLESNVFRGQVS